MNILVTGAFGNMGLSTLQALAGRGHRVRCFDLPLRINKRLARRHAMGCELVWGDVRRFVDWQRALKGQDLVIHLDALVPGLPLSGQHSELESELSHDIHVGGMRQLILAVTTMPKPARIVFTSTLRVYGLTQHLPPPRTVTSPLQPVQSHAVQKAMAEQLLKSSGLTWSVLRLGAAMPDKLIFDKAMFLIPPSNRLEYVHTLDVGVALANAVDQPAIWGKVWLIGGGPRCQLTYGQMLDKVMAMLGQAPLPAHWFSRVDDSVDWLDTSASQALLQYQQRSFDDHIDAWRVQWGPWLALARRLRPLVRAALWARSVLP
jgi:nucleoside-diphosphate-sugar epimerase